MRHLTTRRPTRSQEFARFSVRRTDGCGEAPMRSRVPPVSARPVNNLHRRRSAEAGMREEELRAGLAPSGRTSDGRTTGCRRHGDNGTVKKAAVGSCARLRRDPFLKSRIGIPVDNPHVVKGKFHQSGVNGTRWAFQASTAVFRSGSPVSPNIWVARTGSKFQNSDAVTTGYRMKAMAREELGTSPERPAVASLE